MTTNSTNTDQAKAEILDAFRGLVVASKALDSRRYLAYLDKEKFTVINPSTAILVNEYKQTIRLKNKNVVKQAGGGTQVWSKSGNAWKLVSISASDARQRAGAVF